MRECPSCRTAIRVNRLDGLDEEEKKAQQLIVDIQKAMEEKQYSSAKKMLKRLSQINNNRLHNDQIALFVKDMRNKIFNEEA